MLTSFRSIGIGSNKEDKDDDDGGFLVASHGMANPRRFKTLTKRSQGKSQEAESAEAAMTMSIPLTMRAGTTEEAEPPDYENDVKDMEDEIKDDECPELLKFPDDDIEVTVAPRRMRTETSTVPKDAIEQAQSLFVRNCVKSYSSDWHTVRHNYSKYGGDYVKLQRPGAASGLPEHVYEVDAQHDGAAVDEQGEDQQGDGATGTSAKKESTIIKEGWLTKTPFFDSRGFAAMTMRQFKRRWYAIRQNPDKSFVILQHKDDSSSSAKHMMSLDAVTAVLEGVMDKENGFRVVAAGREHGFIADSEEALKGWLEALDTCVAPNARLKKPEESLEEKPSSSSGKLGISSRQRWVGARRKISAVDRVDSVRSSLQSSMHPELLKFANETDTMNEKKRQETRRYPMFEVCPDLNVKTIDEDENIALEHEELPKEFQGQLQFLVDCNELRFRVADWMMSSIDSTKRGHVEPFFCTLSLFDSGRGIKISEDFHFDINNDYLRSLLASALSHGSPQLRNLNRLQRMTRRQKQRLGSETVQPPSNLVSTTKRTQSLSDIVESDTAPDIDELTAAAGTNEELGPTGAKQALFSVTFPSNEMYLVLRVEKVLQGGSIASVVEPYLKASDSKITEKIKSQAKVFCNRLGQYRMPFAWAARPLLKGGQMDYEGDFSPFFRQERERLSDEDMIRLLQDLRGKQRQTVVPTDVVDVAVKPVPSTVTGCLTSSLVPVKPFAGTLRTHSMSTSLTREVQEVVPLSVYDPHPHNYINLSYRNLLYIHPITIKLDPQKVGTRARNITCYVHIKDSDEPGTRPLKCIYSRALGAPIVHRAETNVLYHDTSPTFYDEVKIELPVNVHRKHHILFTFCHVSCEQSKGAVKRTTPPETIVGFAWLPLVANDRLISNEQSLSISSLLPPNYLAIPCSATEQSGSGAGTGKQGSLASMGSAAKWIDAGKPLFRVNLNFVSTVLTQEPGIQVFFKFCETYYPQTSSKHDDVELCRLLRLLTSQSEVSTFINYLPVLVDQLIHLIVTSKPDLHDVPSLAIKVISFIAGAVIQADREDQLKLYVKYCFATDRKAPKQEAVHCRLVLALRNVLTRENSVMEPMLGNMWFILDIISKSMAQYLHYNDQLKRPRKVRFPDEFLSSTTDMVLTLMQNVIKLEKFPKATLQAIHSIGNFLKDCLSIMDRGHVFKMISTALSVFSAGDSAAHFDMKFYLLRTLCSHEHYMPINMPKMESGDLSDMVITAEFTKRHFLTSVLLKEVSTVLRNEPPHVRYSALCLLRDLMAKHDLDTRYSKAACRKRIARLYWSYVLTVLESISRVNILMIAEAAVATPAASNNLANSASVSSLAAMASFQGSGLRESVEARPTGAPSTPNSTANLPGASGKRKSGTFSEGTKVDGLSVAGDGTGKSLTKVSESTVQRGRTSTASKAEGQQVSQEVVPRETGETEKKDRMRMRSLTFVPSASESVGLQSNGTRPMSSTTSEAPMTPDGADQSLPSTFTTDKFGFKETRCMLSCFLYVIRDIDRGVLLNWWQHCLDRDRLSHMWKEGETRLLSSSLVHLLAFFDVLRTSLQVFQYPGKAAIFARRSKAAMMKSQLEMTYTNTAGSRPASVSLSSALRTRISPTAGVIVPTVTQGPNVAELNIKLEANMGTETTLVVLDLLELFIVNFREHLEENTGNNPLMKRIFSVIITLLEVNQSQVALGHIFASLRAFIHKFSPALFQGGQEYCAELCYQILTKCNSSIRAIRMEACVVFYLLMRCSFEFVEGSFLRVHLQSIVALSQMIADGHLGGSQNFLRRSINSVESFSTRDKSTSDQFPAEVKDLTARLRNVLHATSEMQKHEDDPEVLVEQQYVLAKSYSNAAQLRQTWLQSMAKLHDQHGNYSEAAHCCIHIAGIIAEYLKFRGLHANGAADFATITPNVAKAEGGMKEDLIDTTITLYTEDDYIDVLEESLFWLQKAERYEVMVDLFKLLQPYYDRRRNYEALASSFTSLAAAANKVVEVERTKRRLLGSYFRVAFFGEQFGNDNGIQYIYKEPKVTRLADISLRLEELYGRKFGEDAVSIIKESNKVDVDTLDYDRAYIQVTYVVPYFSEKELETRITPFERNNNLQRFVFETPFTKSSKKSHGEVGEQWIHKTILTTSNTFPYVKKRIAIVEEENFDLTPIEVAIEELSRKLTELTEALQRSPPDKVNLQRVLQGVVSATVNAGPMAYAKAFLAEEELAKSPENHIATLKHVFRELVKQCEAALELNSRIIQSDQILYHEDLASKYDKLAKATSELLDPPEKGPYDFDLPLAGEDD